MNTSAVDGDLDAARILDRGYRTYDGERLGVRSSMASVARQTVFRTLGIHRSARSKVFPVLVIVAAYLPTMIYIGVAVIGNRLQRQGGPGRAMAQQFIPTYAANYGQIVLAILLFAAFVAPETLCPDRRDGMLGLYLASPLRRGSYLLAKLWAIVGLLAIVTVGPPLLLMLGYASQGFGPEGPAGWASTIGRILLAGLAVSALFSAVSMAISSLTTRKAIAAAAVLVLLFGSLAVVRVLIVQAGAPQSLAVLDLFSLPFDAVYRIFGEPSPFVYGGLPPLDATVIYAANFAWVAFATAVVILRYRRLEVGR